MSATKLDRIEHISNMLKEMSAVLRYIDLEDHLKLHDSTPLFNNKHIIDGEKWLFNIFIAEFMEVKRIWSMQRDELWFRYKSWGLCEDNRESQLLNERLALFKKVIKSSNRPALFKKGRTNAWARSLDKKVAGKKASNSSRTNKNRSKTS